MQNIRGHNDIYVLFLLILLNFYRSPERLEGKPYAFSSDLWSVGLLIIELASGEYPYGKRKSFIEMIQNILTSPEPNLPDNGLYSTELRDFLKFM